MSLAAATLARPVRSQRGVIHRTLAEEFSIGLDIPAMLFSVEAEAEECGGSISAASSSSRRPGIDWGRRARRGSSRPAGRRHRVRLALIRLNVDEQTSQGRVPPAGAEPARPGPARRSQTRPRAGGTPRPPGAGARRSRWRLLAEVERRSTDKWAHEPLGGDRPDRRRTPRAAGPESPSHPVEHVPPRGNAARRHRAVLLEPLVRCPRPRQPFDPELVTEFLDVLPFFGGTSAREAPGTGILPVSGGRSGTGCGSAR